MPLRTNRKLGTALVVLALVALVGWKVAPRDSFKLELLVPTAAGMNVGAKAMVNGRPVGQVSSIGVQGNAAKLTVTFDEDPRLHAGTDAHIVWNSVIGRRQVEIVPGPDKNPLLPSGRLISSKIERVELDDLIAALDAPTRVKVKALVAQLEKTLDGNEPDLRSTLTTAGPFVESLGAVLKGVGEDGPAIRSLVTRLHQITSTLSARDSQMAATVANLRSLVGAAATQQRQISAALDEVPSTVDVARKFFGDVPAAVDEAIPLLDDLRPAVEQLPAVARKLNPVLTDLRPTVAELRPTLAAARTLLGDTPALLDSASATLPEIQNAVASAQPAVAFLRPYTPEVIGFLTNWTSLFSAKDRSGHFGRALVIESATSVTSNPGIVPPGFTLHEAPLPGSLVNQPWTDANGDQIR